MAQYTLSSALMVGFMSVLIVIFYSLAIKKRYKIPYLLLTVSCGAAGTGIRYVGLIISNPAIQNVTDQLFFFFLSGTMVFFFFFEESCASLKPNIFGVVIVITTFTISQTFNLYSLSPALSVAMVEEFRMFGLFLYGILGIISFGYFGIKFYYRSYKLTRERMAMVLTFGMVIGLIAYSPVNGSYILDCISFKFRLLVYYKSGIQIFNAKIKSKRNVEIEPDLVAGFFTAINNLFVEALSSETDVENVSSSDATFAVSTGEYISVVVIGEQSTAKLLDAIRSLVVNIEDEFEESLKKHESNLIKYRKIVDLIPSSFPFFKIKND